MTNYQFPMSNEGIKSLYIHVPFCKRKCHYCDFISYPDKEDLIDEYVNTIIKELKTLTPNPSPTGRGASKLGQNTKEKIGVRAFETIYIGGGTPTLLSPDHFEKILGLLKTKFIFNDDIEITIESNPGTAGKIKLKDLRQLGINRLSIGAQTFNDDHLKTLGRIHNVKEIFKFYDNARSVGFENINLDLIFALPGQTFSDWQSDLNQAMHLKPNHLSTYNLIIEEGTNFFGKYKNQEQEAELAMYEHTIDTLTKHGYEHYEISNFARPGQACRHNLTYWKNENYLGIGAAAHSHVNGQRWANPDSIEEYLKAPSSFLPLNKGEMSRSDRGGETIFMGLRLLDGLEADKFIGFEKELTELMDNGLLTRENSHIRLTRQGLYLANEVFVKFV